MEPSQNINTKPAKAKIRIRTLKRKIRGLKKELATADRLILDAVDNLIIERKRVKELQAANKEVADMLRNTQRNAWAADSFTNKALIRLLEMELPNKESANA